jgi:hypothetical protein
VDLRVEIFTRRTSRARGILRAPVGATRGESDGVSGRDVCWRLPTLGEEDAGVIRTTRQYRLQAHGRTVLLEPGGHVSIGRHSSNDLPIDHPEVSRFHAEVDWPRGAARPVIVDLESANGTYLDGDLVDGRAPLRADARLEVGPIDLTVSVLLDGAIVSGAGQTVCRLVGERCPELHGTVLDADATRALLRDLEALRRTATLALVGADGFEAQVTFGGGWVMDARTKRNAGVAALRELLTRDAPSRYIVSREVRPCERTLSVSVREFLDREAG